MSVMGVSQNATKLILVLRSEPSKPKAHMAAPYHATTRCPRCATSIRVCAHKLAEGEPFMVYNVHIVCPSCHTDVPLELPWGIDAVTLQLVSFDSAEAKSRKHRRFEHPL